MKSRISLATKVFWLILLIYMFIGLAVFLTRQICVKEMHMDNEFVHFVFRRDKVLLEEAALYAGNISSSKRIDWESIYPYENSYDEDEKYSTNISSYGVAEKSDSLILQVGSGYSSKINRIKEHISNYVEKYHPGQTYMKWLAGGYNLVTMGREAALASENIYIARDKWLYGFDWNGMDDSNYSTEELDYMADEVKNFYSYLSEKDIGFIFATVGSKPCIYDDELSTPKTYNRNTKYFLDDLDTRGVPNYYLSEMMPHNPTEWYEMYYYTDDHWNERAGLWASGVFAKYLNENAEFSFDLGKFDAENYEKEVREQYYRGFAGRKISPLLWGRESYTRYIPKFETDYEAVHYSESGTDERNGDFIEVFFNDLYDDRQFWSEADFYDQSKGDFKFIENDDLYTIVNKSAPDNSDKKILIIRDSYTANLAPFLSTDVGEVDLIYNPKFTGSIRTYIEKTKPDAVIMMLYEGNITPESAVDGFNSGYHFDLR